MKTRKEILEQLYVGYKDLIDLGYGYVESKKLINEIRDKMKELNMYVPRTKTKLASTKLIRKRLGIWKQKII